MGDEQDTGRGYAEHGPEVVAAETEELESAGAGAEPEREAGAADELESVRRELEVMASRAAENLDLAQRVQAEMDNLRKRTQRDIESAHRYALERFVADLLPVIDSVELGIQASDARATVDSLREGMELTLKKFLDLVEKYGVSVIDPVGEKFTPERHEAVSMAPAEGAEPGTVIAVLQKGYDLNGRLIRPAMVVVAK